MSAGTAMLIICIVYLAVKFEAVRSFFFVVLGIGLGCLWWLVDFGSDKPQTFFYNSQSHPAFLMQAGSICPSDRHIWNHWCVR